MRDGLVLGSVTGRAAYKAILAASSSLMVLAEAPVAQLIRACISSTAIPGLGSGIDCTAYKGLKAVLSAVYADIIPRKYKKQPQIVFNKIQS